MQRLKTIPAAIFFLVVLVALVMVGQVSAKGKQNIKNEPHIPVCQKQTSKDNLNCNARVITDRNGSPKVTQLPAGYGPNQFQTAYGLTNSSTQTIAIVDAYDDSRIKSDLDKYDSTFGLPFFPNCSSTVKTGCFQKVNQNGGTSYPRSNSSWALEISLDVEVAHGICPTCKILLVEANSNSYANLMAAVDRAVSMGAKVVSNSYGSGEFSGETGYDSHFNVPDVAFTFSSGDSGYGTEYPAASRYVTAVGGTSLTLNPDNTYQDESVWSGSGSGCSLYENQPSWQTALGLSGCSNRIIADVSADADPNTGAAVYDSVSYYGRSGWFKVGGTSLASPIIAATYALSGNLNAPVNAIPYANTASLHDIISGSNGSCSDSYLCTAMPGYDGPSGLGSPIGTAAF